MYGNTVGYKCIYSKHFAYVMYTLHCTSISVRGIRYRIVVVGLRGDSTPHTVAIATFSYMPFYCA